MAELEEPGSQLTEWNVSRAIGTVGADSIRTDHYAF